MSTWINIDSDEIEVDEVKKEISIYVTNDDWGSVYAVLTFAQINKLAEFTGN